LCLRHVPPAAVATGIAAVGATIAAKNITILILKKGVERRLYPLTPLLSARRRLLSARRARLRLFTRVRLHHRGISLRVVEKPGSGHGGGEQKAVRGISKGAL
jgi:hypothetical protein